MPTTENRWRRWALAPGFLLAAALAGLGPAAHAIETESLLSIGIQSMVDHPPALPELPASRAGARLYALLAVEQVKAQARLVKPVDETRLARRLVAALESRGFHQADDDQIPDILLTVLYGRGWLRNPYRANGGILAVEVSGLQPDPEAPGTGNAATHSNTGVSGYLMNGMSLAHEAESQKASYEKLFVRIIAWAYPADPQAKARRLWQTTMVVDDPDHRDLNAVASQLFAAGAPYFDRATERNEISIFLPAADARVKVGTPTVVGEPAAPIVPAPAPAPMIAAAPAAALKKFDLPAGAALATLQAFSRQSGEEIIYPADQVQAVQTHAVSGEFSARSALEHMLEQTGLVAVWDEKSGICIIRHGGR